MQYGMFHWGPICLAIYVLPALPIGYLVFVKKQPVYKISQACRPILKGQTDKFVGKVVYILYSNFWIARWCGNITSVRCAINFCRHRKINWFRW